MDNEERAILRLLADRLIGTRDLPGPIRAKVSEAGVDGIRLHVVATGIGLSNAAMVTAVCAAAIRPDAMIMTGVAGAMAARLDVGEVVVANEVVQYDSIYVGEKGTVPMRPGEYVSRESVSVVGFRPCPTLLSTVTSAGVKHGGMLISGAEFSSLPARKAELLARHPNAIAIDMEGAAFMQVAQRASIPAIVVKAVSDRLAPSSGSVLKDYVAHVDTACAASAQMLLQILKQLQLGKSCASS
jgi:5'-methylthioadenosine/S-adenosylhomocysteine nucleosidase